MEYTYRTATPDDSARVVDFINMVFSVAHRPHDYKALLPKVYADGQDTACVHYIAVDGQGGVRGAVALLPGELRVGARTIRTGYIGSVSTHPYDRGKGHMKRLMDMAVEGARRDGIDIILLGGMRQRYGYFGFTPGGLRCVYTVTRENVRHALKDVRAGSISFSPMRGAEEALVDAAWALYDVQPVRAHRSRADFVATLESWSRTPFVVLKDGAFAGYLVATGNGDTFGEVLLRDLADLPAVIKVWVLGRSPYELCIPAALYDHALNRAVGAFAEDVQVQVCQKLRVLDFPKVVGALLPLSAARHPLADGEWSLWIDGRPLTIAVRGGAISAAESAPDGAPHLTAMEAQELLFSPFAEADRLQLPANWLPIPLSLAEADCF